MRYTRRALNVIICIFSGDFIGAVSLKYNAFIVLEGGHFEMTCEATHEDRRPDLQLYFINYSQKRTNVTGFETSGTGWLQRCEYIDLSCLIQLLFELVRVRVRVRVT
jgi:hypothetical protein